MVKLIIGITVAVYILTNLFVYFIIQSRQTRKNS